MQLDDREFRNFMAQHASVRKGATNSAELSKIFPKYT